LDNATRRHRASRRANVDGLAASCHTRHQKKIDETLGFGARQRVHVLVINPATRRTAMTTKPAVKPITPSTEGTAVDFYLRKLRPLIGATITQTCRTGVDEYGDEFFGLIVTLPNGKKKSVIFLADDEGNGPGSIEINDQV